MTNYSLKLLNITDPSAYITKIEDTKTTKYVYIEKKEHIMYCPICGTRMHSKGSTTREVNHPVLQTGQNLVFKVSQHKWKCPNKDCNHYCRDQFNFIEPGKRNTNLVPYAILEAMKDLRLSTSQIAKRFNVSDTYVHQTFMRYVDLPRLSLSRVISIDEVHMNFDNEHKYALVIMDFISGEVIDIVPSRREKDTNPYFLNIPLKERDQVEYLVCDMYQPYHDYIKRYFHNATVIVDSYHVIQLINNKMQIIYNQVRRKLKKEQEARLKEKNQKANRNYKTIEESDDQYILRKFRWTLFMNQDNIKYSWDTHYNKKLKKYLNTYDKEELFMNLDPRFEKMKELKEAYITFNNGHINDPIGAKTQLNEIITKYRNSGLIIFEQIADTLEHYKKAIIASFTYIPHCQRVYGSSELTRISNGLMECTNNFFKDLKRQSKGVFNINYTRNRILWATRKNPAILGVPKTLKEVHTVGKKRGPYNKRKK